MDFNTLKNNFFKNTKNDTKQRRKQLPYSDPFEKNGSSDLYLEYKKKYLDKYAITLNSIKKSNSQITE